MDPQYIIALDQGTTSSRAVLFNRRGQVMDIAQKEFRQIYPRAGWVEQDPNDLWESQREVLFQLLKRNKVGPHTVAALGITNQRETTIVWDRDTGEPVYNAIVWQDKRTRNLCAELEGRGLGDYIRKHTGLVIDAYFSATKIRWILDNVDGARQRAEEGGLAFGTVDSWLIWNLTAGRSHVTDYSNASRTMLFDIGELQWDEKLLEELAIPRSMMPSVLPSGASFGKLRLEGTAILIAGVLGDQQAALFGQTCFQTGDVKNTYGTGCFMLMNTGEEQLRSQSGLLTTVAWGLNDKVYYALEGSVFIAGAAIQWLRDELGLIEQASDSELQARLVEGDHNVYFVPAFAGLGAPYWDMQARGAIFGLTRDTGKAHIIRATLESMAYQTRDVISAMEKDTGIELETLKVDGGAAANDYLMQFQADILDTVVERPTVIESTAQGSAYLAGVYTGFWSKEDIITYREIDRRFTPEIDEKKRAKLYAGWQKAVQRAMQWKET